MLVVDLLAVDLLAQQEGGVAAVRDLDLLQHLANDHLDVLVVDLHALQSIDFLDLVDEVVGQRLDTEDRQDVVRIGLDRHREVAALDVVAFLNLDVLALGDQIFRAVRRHRPG